MRKIFLTLIAFASFASADYLFQPSNICVKSFYFGQSNGYFYYVRSDTGATVSGTTKNYGDDFFPDYEYNKTSGLCQKVASNNSLGLANGDYTYYMSLTGLLTGTLLSLGLFLGLKVS